MREHVVELLVRACQRQQHAVFQGFRDTAGRLVDVAAEHVRLLEIGVRGVENDRLTISEVVTQNTAQA
ncbi:hypothetical protein DF186_17935, partial [Enterococcus hirae]